MVGVGNFFDVVMAELFGTTIDEVAKITRINKQYLVTAVSEFAVATVTAHKPQGSGDLRIKK